MPEKPIDPNFEKACTEALKWVLKKHPRTPAIFIAVEVGKGRVVGYTYPPADSTLLGFYKMLSRFWVSSKPET